MTITSNNGGFVDNANVSITSFIGNADGAGLFTYVFYRPPSTIADIVVYGTPFMSPAACPAESSCVAAIPTLTQWSILFLTMLTIGLIVIRSKNFVT